MAFTINKYDWADDHFKDLDKEEMFKDLWASKKENRERDERAKFMEKYFGGLPFEELLILVKKYHPERMI